nr:TOBE domain-containing protein [Sinorhizobium sp. BG8]
MVETALGRIVLPASAFVAGAPSSGAAVTLCIRPEHFRATAENATTISLGKARITGSAFFGTHHRCHLAADSGAATQLTAHLPQTAKIEHGQMIDLSVNAKDLIALSA